MTRPLANVGVVGAGWIAPLHLRAYRALGIEVRAILAPDRAQAAALAANHGIAPEPMALSRCV